MLPQLPPQPGSVSLIVVIRMRVTRMVLVKLLRAIRSFEFMAFARHSGQRDSHKQQGKKFHRGVS